jgi:hypothetical protein
MSDPPSVRWRPSGTRELAAFIAKALERAANVRGVEDHEDFGKYGFTVGAG